jgi:hypothetical protein
MKYDFEGHEDTRWIHINDFDREKQDALGKLIMQAAEKVVREFTNTTDDPRPICPGCLQGSLRAAELVVADRYENLSVKPEAEAQPEAPIMGGLVSLGPEGVKIIKGDAIPDALVALLGLALMDSMKKDRGSLN